MQAACPDNRAWKKDSQMPALRISPSGPEAQSTRSFEELSEAVDFRTRLQAEISGKGTETFSLNTLSKRNRQLRF
jgi:hypothetical protein